MPMEDTHAVAVPAHLAQKIRCELEQLQLWDGTRRLEKLLNNQVAIPVKSQDDVLSAVKAHLPDYTIKHTNLLASKKAKTHLNKPAQRLRHDIQVLLNQHGLSSELMCEVPTKWERHGDLVIISAAAFKSPRWKMIGDSLWQVVANALGCTRLARHSPVADDGFRSSQVEMVLGEDGIVTHVDNGVRYSYDVTRCMFSAGNITEKLRLASLDCSGETVVDLYAGIGYFTIPYLVHARATHVHACEWNPDAVIALNNNLANNGVADRCTVHPGDNRLLKLEGVADRVNLGLIPSSEDGWPMAVKVLKPEGGVLHVHGNVTTLSQSQQNRHDYEEQGSQNRQDYKESSSQVSSFEHVNSCDLSKKT